VLDFCLAQNNMDDNTIQLVAAAFDTCKHLADNGCGREALLYSSMKLLEKYRAKKVAYTRGTAAMASMVGVDQLQKSLKNLNTYAAGTTEHDEALSMLGCMSYISSYADEIVKAGGIVVLIKLLNSALNQLESNPEKIYKMIAGAARMLGRIASSHANIDALLALGGALSLALVPLARTEADALKMLEYQTFATLLPLLYNYVETHEVAVPCMELVATAAQHTALHKHMIENQVVEICSTCCQYHLSDIVYQKNAISVLYSLSTGLSSLNCIYDYGGLSGIAASISENISNDQIIPIAISLLERFSAVPDAT
ncbi:hypothetical protein IE077_001434, partial [Cardiosporidium cionae]